MIFVLRLLKLLRWSPVVCFGSQKNAFRFGWYSWNRADFYIAIFESNGEGRCCSAVVRKWGKDRLIDDGSNILIVIISTPSFIWFINIFPACVCTHDHLLICRALHISPKFNWYHTQIEDCICGGSHHIKTTSCPPTSNQPLSFLDIFNSVTPEKQPPGKYLES